MFGLGTPEIILIVIVILVLFGAKKIPELMQGIGKGVKEFKKATNDIEKDINSASDDTKPKS
ncbi:MAG TPA: twin-arginine translocase TatA/TatE family subunit [Bacteroidetes bacterium]|nr:twin-arginine translocase TatA/TatE family subunit [Ignavibacteria bacterium]HCA42112.1 twin-arginine translocase TatA/TatE family subunit [Bacteroidota bacterium]HCN37817.1 twin-arginine translocase TatA/TatE family subunit [Bacteroidota bacterium]